MRAASSKDILKPSSKNRRFYKCLQRIDHFDRSSPIEKGYHKYTLKGFLNPDFPIPDIYLLYFHSYYQQNTTSPRKKEHTSCFYQLFLEYIYLHNLFSQDSSKQDHKHLLISEISHLKRDNKQLVEITKELLHDYQNKHQQLTAKLAKLLPYQSIQEVKKTIKTILGQLYQKLENKFDDIRKTEVLPQSLTQKQDVIRYVRSSFQKIQNIHVFLKCKKVLMIEQMKSSLTPYMSMTYNCQQSSDNPKHIIMFSRLSPEAEPVLTKLHNFLLFRQREKHSLTTPVEADRMPHLLTRGGLQLVKDLALACRNFYKLTNSVYPLISTDDIVFDQKSLKPVLSQTSLIYDCLGVNSGNNNSIELQLTVGGTPSPLHFEQSPLEFQEDQQWALNRKYYLQKKEKKEGDDEMIILREQEDYYQNQEQDEFELERLDGCGAKSKETAQKVHVWRLLCIFYYILTEGKHLVKQAYNHQLGTNSQDKTPSFSYSAYKNVLKGLHSNIQANSNLIVEYFGLNRNRQSHQREPREDGKFGFRLQQLEEVMGVQLEDDSLLERLRFQKFKSQLWVRSLLCKEIMLLIMNDKNEKSFKRLLNAKKYTIMFTVTSMEHAYETIYPILQSQQQPSSRKYLTIELKDFKKLSFQKEKDRRKSYVQNTFRKISQYLGRQDEQFKYFQNNSEFEPAIKIIFKNFQDLNSIEKSLNDYQQTQRMDLKQENTSKYHQNITKVKYLASQSFNSCSKILGNILAADFQEKVDRIEEFHKIDNPGNNKIDKKSKPSLLLLFLSKRLYYLLMSFHTVSPQNWRKYQNFVLPVLMSPQSLGVRGVQKKVQDLNSQQLQELISRMECIKDIISEDPPFQMKQQTQTISVEK